MVEKLTFNYIATAQEDIPAVTMPIARCLKTLDICAIVLCVKKQLELLFIAIHATPVSWMDYFRKGEMPIDMDLN
jgi:hypothetical protein